MTNTIPPTGAAPGDTGNPRILQVWKRYNLGLGWSVSFLSDGSATFWNSETDQRLDLPEYSIETLRKAIIRAEDEERRERNAHVAQPFRSLLNDFFARPEGLR